MKKKLQNGSPEHKTNVAQPKKSTAPRVFMKSGIQDSKSKAQETKPKVPNGNQKLPDTKPKGKNTAVHNSAKLQAVSAKEIAVDQAAVHKALKNAEQVLG